MDSIHLYIVFLPVLLLFSAFFSGSEAALFSLRRTQLKTLESSSTGKRINRLRSTPRKLLVSILIGNLFVNIFSTSAVTSISIRLFGEKGVGASFAIMTVLILVVGEIIPKTIAINQPIRFSRVIVYPLSFFHMLFLPLRAPLAFITEAVITFLKRRLGVVRRSFTHEELITAVGIGRFEGDLGKFEHEVLSNVLSFRGKIVREIMTPSVSVFSLPAAMRIDELFDAVIRQDFSRVPIHGGSSDEIVGVLHIKDLLRGITPGNAPDIASILRPVYHIPETAPVAELFRELAERKTHLAVVIDEYGSFVGIVTMEDVLEEIVGEIRDAGEPRTEEFKLISDKKIIVLGTMEIDDFNEVFRTNLVDEEHETIAGYVLAMTGKIPLEGETIQIGDLKFHVISARPNVIRKLRVEKI
ncbi:MAG: hemolysin family protein [Candidatus Latescibacterota bacterium]